jgi:monoamine oxidase
MARSVHSMLRGLYERPSDAVLLEMGIPKRRRLYTDKLLPGGLDGDALAACEGLRDVRVAVVGGGFAGLMAAWYLRQCNVAVTVFEASGRVGGRVLSDYAFVPGKVVEAGAELIGSNHPMWVELAALLQLPLVKISKEKDYADAGLNVRIRFGDYDLTDADKDLLESELPKVFDSIGAEAAPIDEESPWLSPDAATYDQQSVSAALDRHCGAASSLVRTVLEYGIGNDNCAPPGQQSYLGLLTLVKAGRMDDTPEGLRGYWEYTETDRCMGGNERLASSLAAPLTDVRLSSPVSRITVTENAVGIAYGDAAPAEESFDYVILAAPPTSWPSVECTTEAWDPSVRTMQHGRAVKHLSAFDRTFWQDEKLAPSASWDALGTVWEGTDRQESSPGGFDLSVYSGGAYVLPGADYPGRLATIFPGYAPSRVQFVDWPNTPYVMTGYSVPAVGQVCTVGQALSVPLGGRLIFAGEQACIGYFGYMEGALQSGARASRAIVTALCPEA